MKRRLLERDVFLADTIPSCSSSTSILQLRSCKVRTIAWSIFRRSDVSNTRVCAGSDLDLLSSDNQIWRPGVRLTFMPHFVG